MIEKAGSNEVQEEEIEGRVHEVEGDTEEDMLVFACFIAECLTFKKHIDIKSRGIDLLRERVVGALIGASECFNY